jgi:hypothetical protein
VNRRPHAHLKGTGLIRRRPPILASLAATAGLALLAGGCGGGGSPRVASVITSTTAATTTPPAAPGLVGYAACMRSHGVPSFPDPDSTGEIPKSQVVTARTNNPSRFDSASSTCRRLLPNGSLGPQQTPQQIQTQLADMLSFAKCMRNHGLIRFPDPNQQGRLTVAMVQAQGIDVHSPTVLHDAQACLPASHGALTPAKIAQAIQDAGS